MEFKDKVIKPFTPIKVKKDESGIKVEVIGRKYIFNESAMLSSIITRDKELLVSPMRFVGIEDGERIEWKIKYCKIFSESDEKVVILGSMQSDKFIINIAYNIEYDGYCKVSVKLMPRGHTVAEEFGLANTQKAQFKLERLWLEIPLKEKSSEMYHIYPIADITDDSGKIYKKKDFDTCSGELGKGNYRLPFETILWLGDDEKGISVILPSDENIQPMDGNAFIEIDRKDGERVLRYRLLDSPPIKWEKFKSNPQSAYVISFSMGIQVTPVKPLPDKTFPHNALHIDCFKKIEGNYIDFLSNPVKEGDTEIGYDRIKRLGVNTLILHEKWNDIQNYPYLTEFSSNQLKTIINECHARGIKVIPYFGYEISSLAPDFDEIDKDVIVINEHGNADGGWWRVPPQRDYPVCYNSSYRHTFVNGIKELIEKYRFDGVYIDGTIYPRKCINESHGCGYIGADGKRHGTYPIDGIRQTLKELYAVIEPIGGIINFHSNACNFAAMAFTHLDWAGESIQFKLVKEGASDLPLDFLRAEYGGRNFGVQMEMIVYENRPIWRFEQAMALGMVHGIFPRPNDIGEPLELMSKVWEITNVFPVDKSAWLPYWKNDDNFFNTDKIKVSEFRYIDVCAERQSLIIASNLSGEKVIAELNDEKFKYKVLYGNAEIVGNRFEFKEFDFSIIFLREKD